MTGSQSDFSGQRPAYSITAPAIARNLIFRLHNETNPRWVEDKTQRRENWDCLINEISKHTNKICKMYHADFSHELKAPGDYSSINENKFSLDRSVMIPVCDREEGYPYRFRIRIDIHHEIFAISYLIDDIDTNSEWKCNISDKIRIISESSKLSNKNSIDIKNCTQWLFDDCFSESEINSFFSDIENQVQFEKLKKLAPSRSNYSEIESWINNSISNNSSFSLGVLIADFRGIMLSCKDHESNDITYRISEDEDKFQNYTPQIDGNVSTFFKEHESLIYAVAGKHEVDLNPRSGGESVVCGMFNGRALYAAELGRWGDDYKGIIPVRYLIAYGGHSDKQLGRLVRRLHVLGELRHAALIDYESVTQEGGVQSASRRLRKLGEDLEDISNKIELSNQDTSADTNIKINEFSDLDIKDLRKLVVDLNNINSLCKGGLLHRIERSRYYAKGFTDLLNHMQCVPIEPWQPYNKFVERYIYQLFSRIDVIGRRYENMGRRIDRLLFFKQAESSDSYQKNVAFAMSKLIESTEKLNSQSDNQKKLLNSLSQSSSKMILSANTQISLLARADKFAAVIVLYYLFSTTDKFIEKFEINNYEINFVNMNLEKFFIVLWLIFTLVFLIFGPGDFLKKLWLRSSNRLRSESISPVDSESVTKLNSADSQLSSTPPPPSSQG